MPETWATDDYNNIHTLRNMTGVQHISLLGVPPHTMQATAAGEVMTTLDACCTCNAQT